MSSNQACRPQMHTDACSPAGMTIAYDPPPPLAGGGWGVGGGGRAQMAPHSVTPAQPRGLRPGHDNWVRQSIAIFVADAVSRCTPASAGAGAEQRMGTGPAAPPVTRCRQRVSVDIERVVDGLGAAPKHQRVLVRRLTASALDSFLCCGAKVTRHTPSRQRKFIARRSDFEG